MKSLTLTVLLPDEEAEDTETLLCGFGNLLTQEKKIFEYTITRRSETRPPKRGPYSPEEK